MLCAGGYIYGDNSPAWDGAASDVEGITGSDMSVTSLAAWSWQETLFEQETCYRSVSELVGQRGDCDNHRQRRVRHTAHCITVQWRCK